MLGRRWKQLASLRRNSDFPRLLGEPKPSETSSSSSTSPVEMPSNSYAETLVLGLGETLDREYGSWEDVDYYFV